MNMPMKGWIIVAALALVCLSAQAATRVKANNTDNLNLTSSWTGGVAPGSADVAQWNSTVTAANTVLLGANASYQGISVVNPAGAVAVGGTNSLTLGCLGIDMSTATADLTLTNAALTLLSYASPAWNVASGRTLTVNPAILTRSTRTSLGILGAGSVVCTNFTNSVTGIIGPWARYGATTSTKYATVSGSSIVGYSGVSATAAEVADTIGMTNYDVTAVGTLGLGVSFNTLRYTGSSGTVTGSFQANGLLNAGAGALTLSGNVTIGADKELSLTSPDSTRTLTLSGAVADYAGSASSVLVAGGGTVSLNASNTYSGVTVLSMGVLSINKNNSLGATNGNTVIYYSGRLTDGGRLALSGNVTLTEPITIVGGEINGGGLVIYIAASGETNTLAGPITIATSNHTRIGAGSGSVLNINAPITSAANSVVLAPNGGLIYVNTAFNVPGSFFLHGGPGSVILNSSGNNFATALVQQGNTLKLGVPDAMATNKNVVVGSSALVNTDDANTSSGRLDLGGVSQTINSLLGYLNGSGAVVPYSRVITNSVASLGTLTVGSANGDSVFHGRITDGAGAVALGKIGTGILMLSGTNAFSGATTVSGGTLVLSNALAVQNSTLTCTNSGSVRFCSGLTAFTFGGLAGTRNIALTNEAGALVALTVGGNNSSTVYSGALTAGGSLSKTGSGTLTLAGVNTYTGTTSLASGTLALGCDNALNVSNRLVVSGGTLSPGSYSSTLQRLVVAGTGTLALGDGSCHLAFADSSEAWAGTLEIAGTLGPTSLRFGTDASGLSQAQLDSLRVGGKKVWLALNAQGYLRRVTGTLIRVL
jgi:autotransporter-associated beta strand protein